MGKVTISTLEKKKAAGEKFVCITAYDATFARIISRAGAEAILVGDSLGMVLQGHDSTIPVTIEHMTYHTECVCRAQPQSLVIADMPFMSYPTAQQTMANATRLLQAGAQMVKMEGGTWLSDTISMLVERGIPVCAHLGLTPQSVNKLGGFRVQGREASAAAQLRADAAAVQAAGADLLVLECVPRALAAEITRTLEIPVIGIGAGADCDGQVLVMHDALGLRGAFRTPRFVKDFLAGRDSVEAAFAGYVAAVRAREFPGPEHGFD